MAGLAHRVHRAERSDVNVQWPELNWLLHIPLLSMEIPSCLDNIFYAGVLWREAQYLFALGAISVELGEVAVATWGVVIGYGIARNPFDCL